ncbi:hypothetical protein V498_07774, partial [Pseudogymnoascus sp. VKM F-4517 (FW-2822)]
MKPSIALAWPSPSSLRAVGHIGRLGHGELNMIPKFCKLKRVAHDETAPSQPW